MDIEEMEGEAEARRLGSLQTEVGGATRAMSGIRETEGAGGSRRGRGPRVRTDETAGSRMVVTSCIVTERHRDDEFLLFFVTDACHAACHGA